MHMGLNNSEIGLGHKRPKNKTPQYHTVNKINVANIFTKEKSQNVKGIDDRYNEFEYLNIYKN